MIKTFKSLIKDIFSYSAKKTKTASEFIKTHKDLVVLTVLLVIAGVSHGYNMFQFPYYENDEGTYISQAWSLLKYSQLSNYTYWYDHAPGGWIFITLWTMVTGGFFTFGTAIDSGRVFMLVIHILSAFLIYAIARKLSGKNLPGIIAVLFFSLSPLAIYFQRRVLLDNLMIFWVLLSVFLIINTKSKLRYIIASAIAFGIAVLTKENAILFLPGIIYALYISANTKHRLFAIWKWLAISGVIISLYFIYALLKHELFPTGFLGDTSEHVSLIGTLQTQYARGSGLPFWDSQSDFMSSYQAWLIKDKVLIYAGILGSILSAIASIKVKYLRIPTLLATAMWFFMLRGKLVIDFYIVALIPFMVMQIGFVTDLLIQIISRDRRKLSLVLSALAIILSVYALTSHPIGQYTRNETAPQRASINWIKDNLPEDAFIVIDAAVYVDLHEARFPGDKVFTNAEWAWKVAKDPEVYDKKLDNDWRNIEYIALSHEVTKQIKDNNFPYTKNALENSYLIRDWYGGNAYRDLDDYISTNGDWASVYRVLEKEQISLYSSWRYYQTQYIHSYGRVIDPQTNTTTSEGQSYAMLRAVWLNDRDTFDGIYAWTKDHFQHRLQDKLFAWQYSKGSVTDSNTASDADIDIALALAFASAQWHDATYKQAAQVIISDIWKKEVVSINGTYYLLSAAGGKVSEGYLVNPSYFSPAHYRVFAEIDPSHPWEQLADDSYTILNKIASQNKTGLPNNWVIVSPSGSLSSAQAYIDTNPDQYGFDAFRTFWRIALDAEWYNTQEAKIYLARYTKFFKEEEKDDKIVAVYETDGRPTVAYDSLSTLAGPLAVYKITDAQAAKSMYETNFQKIFNPVNGYWDDGKNYYDQNWAWFATGLYTESLINLWEINKNEK